MHYIVYFIYHISLFSFLILLGNYNEYQNNPQTICPDYLLKNSSTLWHRAISKIILLWKLTLAFVFHDHITCLWYQQLRHYLVSTKFEGAIYPLWIIYFIFGIILKWEPNDVLLYWSENSINAVTMLFGYYQTTKGVCQMIGISASAF